jgi:hypothetical protein
VAASSLQMWQRLFPFFIPSFVNISLPNNDFCVASFLYCIQKLEKINWINMFLSTNSPLFAKSSNQKNLLKKIISAYL